MTLTVQDFVAAATTDVAPCVLGGVCAVRVGMNLIIRSEFEMWGVREVRTPPCLTLPCVRSSEFSEFVPNEFSRFGKNLFVKFEFANPGPDALSTR